MVIKKKRHNVPKPGIKLFTLAIPNEIFNAIAQTAALEFRDQTKMTLQLLYEALTARGVRVPLPLQNAAQELERITHSETGGTPQEAPARMSAQGGKQ